MSFSPPHLYEKQTHILGKEIWLRDFSFFPKRKENVHYTYFRKYLIDKYNNAIYCYRFKGSILEFYTNQLES